MVHERENRPRQRVRSGKRRLAPDLARGTGLDAGEGLPRDLEHRVGDVGGDEQPLPRDVAAENRHLGLIVLILIGGGFLAVVLNACINRDA